MVYGFYRCWGEVVRVDTFRNNPAPVGIPPVPKEKKRWIVVKCVIWPDLVFPRNPLFSLD